MSALRHQTTSKPFIVSIGGYDVMKVTAAGIVMMADATVDISAADIATALASPATGGSASAGSGKQYVALKFGSTTYKLLHDGTV